MNSDHLSNLLLAAQRGDHDALEQFIAATQADVWRLCHYLGDPDTVDDLAQETFERAIGSLHRYRADGPAKHWILTIARRTCADSTRRRQRQRRLQVRMRNQPLSETATLDSDGLGDLDDLLAELDDDRRAAFVTTQILGLHYDEAAAVLDCPVGTIRSRVARARADLVGMVERAESDARGTSGDNRGEVTGRRNFSISRDDQAS